MPFSSCSKTYQPNYPDLVNIWETLYLSNVGFPFVVFCASDCHMTCVIIFFKSWRHKEYDRKIFCLIKQVIAIFFFQNASITNTFITDHGCNCYGPSAAKQCRSISHLFLQHDSCEVQGWCLILSLQPCIIITVDLMPTAHHLPHSISSNHMSWSYYTSKSAALTSGVSFLFGFFRMKLRPWIPEVVHLCIWLYRSGTWSPWESFWDTVLKWLKKMPRTGQVSFKTGYRADKEWQHEWVIHFSNRCAFQELFEIFTHSPTHHPPISVNGVSGRRCMATPPIPGLYHHCWGLF